MVSSSKVTYLSVNELLQIHHSVVEKFNGKHGVMAQGRLRDAAWAPYKAIEAGEVGYADLHRLAAILIRAICDMRPFAWGNVKTAFMAAHQFLYLNDVDFFADSEELSDQLAVDGTLDGLEVWLIANCEPLVNWLT